MTHEELTEPFSLMLVLTSSLSNGLSRGTKQPFHDDKEGTNRIETFLIPGLVDFYVESLVQCSSHRCTVIDPAWLNVQ